MLTSSRVLLLAAALAGPVAVFSAESGGVLRVAVRSEPRTLNPVIAADSASRDIIRRLHSDLVTIDHLSQKTVPALAESWTKSADGRKYFLKLRRGLRFSDGSPFSADDVVFSWSLYLDESLHSPQRDLLLIDGQPIRAVKIADDSVEFDLPRPYAAAERLFDSLAILPRHRLEEAWKKGKLREAWTLNTPPPEIAGLGPFRLKTWKPGESVLLERNPYYWRRAPKGGAAMPYLDGIEFQVLPDDDVALARFASGDLDILNRPPMKSIAFLESHGGIVADPGPGLEYNFLCFNLSPGSSRLGWFSSREFRQALSAAVDREAIVKLVYQGKASPLWGNVSPGNRLWYRSDLPHPPRSLARARELLAQAGFQAKPNGELTDRNGARVEFTLLVSSSSPERVQMANLLRADFAQIGIEANVVLLDFRAVLDRVLNTRQFDTVLLGLGGGDPDPNPEMNVWLSSGGSHLWNPSQKTPATPWEAELDSLMNRQMVTIDETRRRKLYDRVQEIVATEMPVIFLASPDVVVAARGNVGNFKPAVIGHFTLWNADELYLKTGAGPAKR